MAFLILFMIMILLFAGSWLFLFENYQKQRILTFLRPSNDPKGSGYHISQSLIAVGSGRIFGRGFASNSQAGLKFLPERHADFIFAVLAEQRGLAGVLFVLILFAVLLWKIAKISLNSSNNFSRLFAVEACLKVSVKAKTHPSFIKLFSL